MMIQQLKPETIVKDCGLPVISETSEGLYKRLKPFLNRIRTEALVSYTSIVSLESQCRLNSTAHKSE